MNLYQLDLILYPCFQALILSCLILTGLKTVSQILELSINKSTATEYVTETLELYLTFNKSIFNNKNY